MILLSAVMTLAAAPVVKPAAAYDPLQVGPTEARVWDGTVSDTQRTREIPVRVYLPDVKGPAPVILFSHGLGGSRENSPFLGQHWARRGYVAVFMQHAGSDDHVWKDEVPAHRISAMQDAANVKNFLLRVKDVPAVVDALTTWNGTKDHPLNGKLDLAHIGMSGHSFGAATTQGVSGESFPGADHSFQRFTASRPQ